MVRRGNCHRSTMRWNVLFDELEHRFDEIAPRRDSVPPGSPQVFRDQLRASLVQAKDNREPCRLMVRYLGLIELHPRTIGRDFVAGSIPALGVDAAVNGEAIWACEPVSTESLKASHPATFTTFLEVWAQRQQRCVLVVEGEELHGVISHAGDSSVRLTLPGEHQRREWMVQRASIELIRTLTSAEKERVDG